MLIFDAMNCSRIDADYVRQLQSAGVHAFHTSVIWGERIGLRETIEKLTRLRAAMDNLNGAVVLASDAEDIHRAAAANRIAVVLGLQNTTPVEDDETSLVALRQLGVRIVQLTYNERNLAGDGCKERRDAGLSNFGVRVVHMLNRLHMAIDVSHAGEQTLLDAVSESTVPVICSHANSRTLCDDPRNLSDRSISAIAEHGGVIGITSIGHFVKKESPTLEAMLDHVDHVVRLVGPDHVAIGSDLFEGRFLDVQEMAMAFAKPYGMGPEFFALSEQPVWAIGRQYGTGALPDPSWARRAVGFQRIVELPNVERGLRQRGYDRRHIEQIMGGNLLRVLDKIWRS